LCRHAIAELSRRFKFTGVSRSVRINHADLCAFLLNLETVQHIRPLIVLRIIPESLASRLLSKSLRRAPSGSGIGGAWNRARRHRSLGLLQTIRTLLLVSATRSCRGTGGGCYICIAFSQSGFLFGDKTFGYRSRGSWSWSCFGKTARCF